VSFVDNTWWSDDDQLLATLREAVREAHAVPAEFIEAGRAAFAWRNFDAELAALIYDSQEEPALTRNSDTATLRALTFASPRLTIELEITADGLLGQVVPIGRAEIDVQTRTGDPVTVEADELGCFVIRPMPAEPFRLRCRVGTTVDILTSWIHL
jgi:hypothetical protein